MNESKDSRFTGDAGEEPTPRPGLRASNTTKTLAPRDISWPTATLRVHGYAGAPADVLPEIEEAIQNAQADNRLAGLPDPFKTYDPVQKTDWVPYDPSTEPKPEKYNCLPVDWPTAQETMGLPKSPEPKKIYSVAELAGRIERLEEQLDGLLDRIYRIQHKVYAQAIK